MGAATQEPQHVSVDAASAAMAVMFRERFDRDPSPIERGNLRRLLKSFDGEELDDLDVSPDAFADAVAAELGGSLGRDPSERERDALRDYALARAEAERGEPVAKAADAGPDGPPGPEVRAERVRYGSGPRTPTGWRWTVEGFRRDPKSERMACRAEERVEKAGDAARRLPRRLHLQAPPARRRRAAPPDPRARRAPGAGRPGAGVGRRWEGLADRPGPRDPAGGRGVARGAERREAGAQQLRAGA